MFARNLSALKSKFRHWVASAVGARRLTIVAATALSLQFIHMPPAAALMKMGGQDWTFENAKAVVNNEKTWKIIHDQQGGVDKAEVMKFLHFAANTPNLTFQFKDERDFINAIITFDTGNHVVGFSQVQHVLTGKGMQQYLPGVKELITPSMKKEGNVAASERNFIGIDYSNYGELKDIATLLSNIKGGNSLRLFRAMNCTAARALDQAPLKNWRWL